MDEADYLALEQRMGRERLAKRLLRQAGRSAKLLHQGEGIFRLERFIPIDALVAFGLRVSGLSHRAYQNFLDVQIVPQEWKLQGLPPVFDGFRLLQLSDLHLDLDTALGPIIEQLIRQTPHDAAVLTGDYRSKTDGDHNPCIREMVPIINALAPQRWGILGNHDFIDMVPPLETAGLPMLLNEAAFAERDGNRLWIAGIDDPHFYQTHDLESVRRKIPSNACSILLSHSPETFEPASRLGFDLQLSGHTHGGQLCLPGGRAIVLSCRVEEKFICGRWSHGTLQGYTSPGTGSCGVAARLNCPPEITLHILRVG